MLLTLTLAVVVVIVVIDIVGIDVGKSCFLSKVALVIDVVNVDGMMTDFFRVLR